MNRSGLEKICNQASNFWKQQFTLQQKQEYDQSTTIGSTFLENQTILEISAKKTEEFLFPCNENHIEKCDIVEEEQPLFMCEQQQQFEIEENYEAEASCSFCSDCQNRKKDRKKQRSKTSKSNKKRFSISEEAHIMEEIRKGTSFNDIAQQIPGSTVVQIKHHFMKKLKICSKNSDLKGQDIADIIIRIQQLQMNNQIENTTKIIELKQLISEIENHLHQTKRILLEKYLILFQQQQQ